VIVRVIDNGFPPAEATAAFTVTVLLPPRVSATRLANGTISLTLPSVPGKTYRVEYTDDLSAAQWFQLPDVFATGQTLTINDNAATTSQRFYRVRAVD
jgi:hypothetical protein